MATTNNETASPSATAGPVNAGSMRRAMLREFWFYFSQNKGAVIGLVVFSVIVLIALAAPLIAPHSPTLQNRGAFLLPPFWQEGGSIT